MADRSKKQYMTQFSAGNFKSLEENITFIRVSLKGIGEVKSLVSMDSIRKGDFGGTLSSASDSCCDSANHLKDSEIMTKAVIYSTYWTCSK